METLGSLVDKLSIINLKLWHCQEALHAPDASLQSAESSNALKAKNSSLLGQRSAMITELNEWITRAVADPENTVMVNPQNKMYGRFRKDS